MVKKEKAVLRARARREATGGKAPSAEVAGPIPDDCFSPDGVRLLLPAVKGGTLGKISLAKNPTKCSWEYRRV